jgi:uncharacterized protein YrzB (UPF0473 family)
MLQFKKTISRKNENVHLSSFKGKNSTFEAFFQFERIRFKKEKKLLNPTTAFATTDTFKTVIAFYFGVRAGRRYLRIHSHHFASSVSGEIGS